MVNVGRPVCEDSSYVSAIEEADEFFQRIWGEVQRRGAGPESQPLVFVGDGAEWIWKRVKDLRNSKSIEILDFCRAASMTCKELYGEQTPDYYAHYPRWTKLLRPGKRRDRRTDPYAGGGANRRASEGTAPDDRLPEGQPASDGLPPLPAHETTHQQRNRRERLLSGTCSAAG